MATSNESSLTRFAEHASEIEPRLYLGSEKAGELPAQVLKDVGITTIIIPAHTGLDTIVHPTEFAYYRRYVPDIAGYPLLPLLPQFIRRIEAALEDGRGAVLVHCAAGRSRSAAVVIAYLMVKHDWRFEVANTFVQKKRKCVSTKFEDQLRLWYDVRFDATDSRIPKLSRFNQVEEEEASGA